MPWWQALILGIVQGLGEFLPISSSGHLVLFQNIFGFEGNELLFDSLLHLGTLIAVFVALWPDIWSILKKPIRKVTLMIIIATIPAILAALFLEDFINKAFGGQYLGTGFLITAVILLITAKLPNRSKDQDLDKVSLKQAGTMGLMQALAILPGVSRSGSTICGGLYTGGNREAVTRFSFLMSIPAILGALVFQVKDIAEVGISGAAGGLSLAPVLIGMVAAAVSGFIALKWMIKLVKEGKLWKFGIYVGILGVLVTLDQLVFHIVF